MPELPPWLTQPADPGKAFLQGAQTGSVIAQSWNQNAITRSRLRLGEQEEQLNTLKLRNAIRERDKQIEAEFVMEELGAKVAPLLEQGRAQDARSLMLAAAARKTVLLHLPQYPELMKDVEAAVVTETVRMQHQSIDSLRKTQEAENKANAERLLRHETSTAKPEFLKLNDALRTTSDPAERARIEARMASMSKPAGVNEPEFIDLLNRREQAVKSGNTNEVQALDTRLAFLGGERPDTTSPEYLETLAALKRAESSGDKEQADRLKARLDKMTAIGRGRGVGGAGGASGDLTTANVTKAQETLTSAEDALGTILQILPLWSMETTGPVGTAGRAFEATVGQVLPGVTSEARSRIDTLAPLFQGQLAKLFRSDAQMAEPERKSVAEAVPKPSASLNPTKASQQGQQAVLVLMQRARRAAEQLGQPLSAGLDPVQVANKVRQAVSESGLPVIEGFKTVDELRAEMRGKQRGKSAEEQQRILREYAAKIAASPYRDLAVPNAATPLPNDTLDFMQGR